MQTPYLERVTLTNIQVQRGTATSPCTLFGVKPSCTDEPQATGFCTSSEQVAFTPDGKRKINKKKEKTGDIENATRYITGSYYHGDQQFSRSHLEHLSELRLPEALVANAACFLATHMQHTH